MSKELQVQIATIVTALHDTGGSPESMLYIFLSMDINRWNLIRDLLRSAGLIQIKSNYVTLTPKGTELAIKVNQAIGQN